MSHRYIASTPSWQSPMEGTRHHNLLLGLIFLLLFMWSNGFGLSVFDLSDRFKVLQLISIFVIIALSALVIIFKGWRKVHSNFYVVVVFGIIFCAMFPTFLYLVVLRGLSPIEVFRVTLPYSGLFIVVILMSFRTRSEFVERLTWMSVITVTAYVTILLLLSLFPDIADDMIQKTSERYGHTRISLQYGLNVLGIFAFFFFLVKAFSVKGSKKNVYISAVVLFLLFHLTTSIGRRDILSIFVVVLYYWLFYLSNIKKIYGVLLVIFFISSIWFVPQFEKARKIFPSILHSTSEDFATKEGTIGVRMEGIKFNFQIFRDTGYLGVGILSDRLQSNDPYYYGREIFRFNPNDHGLFAVIYRFGPLGVIFTFVVLVRIFKDLNIIRRYGAYQQQHIAMAIHLVLVNDLVGFTHVFWKPLQSFVYGLLFYMIWRMRKDVWLVKQQEKFYQHF
jgi:hypothetical protein